MLKIDGKTFMNIQEAVQWLLDNNCIPFQCTANYAPLTEIGLGTIVNPTPAKVRIGSIIFFADSKVSTVVGITENGFICSDQYNDLVDDVTYVSNVALNASGHLIVTLSNGTNIDAGLIKQVSSFSINASQHLIATYNDGSTSDLGAIFQGNINIAGTINATRVTGDEIVETMSGYGVTNPSPTYVTPIYAGACKNGNKITFVFFATLVKDVSISNTLDIAGFTFPSAVGNKLYPFTIGAETRYLDDKEVQLVDASDASSFDKVQMFMLKSSSGSATLRATGLSALPNKTYLFRYEITLLLSENLAS